MKKAVFAMLTVLGLSSLATGVLAPTANATWLFTSSHADGGAN